MKNTVQLFLAALCLFSFTSCQKAKEKIDIPVEFDIPYVAQQAIPGSTISTSGNMDIVSPKSATDSEGKFSGAKTSKDLIDEVKMTKLEITNLSGTLDFLDSVKIYIRGSGLGDVLVAQKNGIPKGLLTLACDLTGADVKQHIFKDSIQFKINVSFNSIRPTEQSLKIIQTAHVKGKLL